MPTEIRLSHGLVCSAAPRSVDEARLPTLLPTAALDLAAGGRILALGFAVLLLVELGKAPTRPLRVAKRSALARTAPGMRGALRPPV